MKALFDVIDFRLEELCKKNHWYYGKELVLPKHPEDVNGIMDLAKQISTMNAKDVTASSHMALHGEDDSIVIAEEILNWACDIILMYE